MRNANARENPPTRESFSPFHAWGDFHARLCFALSTIPEEKWGTTRSLFFFFLHANLSKDNIDFYLKARPENRYGF